MKNIVTLCAAAYASSKGHGFWDHDKGCNASLCVCVNRDPLMKLVLIHSELSEALEEYRRKPFFPNGSKRPPLGEMQYEDTEDGEWLDAARAAELKKSWGASSASRRDYLVNQRLKPVGFMSELADVAIRVFDFAQACDESATAAVVENQLAAGNQEHASGARGLVDMLGVVSEIARRYEDLAVRSDQADVAKTKQNFAVVLYDAHAQVTNAGAAFQEQRYGFRNKPPDYEDVGGNLGTLLFIVEQIALSVSGDIDQAIEIKMVYNTSRPFRHGGKTC